MSKQLNSKAQSEVNSVLMSEAEVDHFLAKVRQEVAENTFDVTNQECLQNMVRCLGDSRGMVRLGFADTLGKVGKPALPFLLAALRDDPDPVVRRASGKTLTLIAAPEAIPTLVHALLNDQDTVVKGSVVGALARTGAAAVPVLLEILASPEHPESIKGHATWALSFIGQEAKEYLEDALQSKSTAVRAAMVGVLAKIAEDEEEDEAFNLLIKLLQDEAETIRSEAAAALANLNNPAATSPLLDLLVDVNGESRKAAALALMKLKDPIALKGLENALSLETEPQIQQLIKLAISQIEQQVEEDDWE